MAGPRYVADAPDRVRAVELDGLTASFHAPSGQTHILAPPAPQILEVLQEEPGNVDEILARISALFAVVWEEGSGAGEALRARVAELEAAGLVRRL